MGSPTNKTGYFGRAMPILIVAVALALLAPAQTAMAEEMSCEMCHPDRTQGNTVHPAVLMGCTICHVGVDFSSIPHKFTSGVMKGLSAEPPDLCFQCHDAEMFSGKANVHMPVEAGMCTTCHNPHSTNESKLLQQPIRDLCFMCHDSEMFSKKIVHAPVAMGQCPTCHNPHQSDKAKLLNEVPPDLCFKCHRKESFFGPTIHAPVGVGECVTCHNPHSSENRKILNAKPPELCFQCHEKSKFFKKSLHQPVVDGRCTKCHRAHAGQNEFLLIRKGNILCRRCHSSIEKKPHAVAGFSRAGHPLRGRKDPVREGKTFGCLSCHLPHTSDSIRLFRYKASGVFDLCTACHKM